MDHMSAMTDKFWSDRAISILYGGAVGSRTPDPHNAIVVLYQLSYDPIQKKGFIVEEGLLVKTKMSSFDKNMNAGHQETFDESIVTWIRLLLNRHSRRVDALTNRQPSS